MENQGIEPTGAKSVKKTKIDKVWKNIGDKMMMLLTMAMNGGLSWSLSDLAKTIQKQNIPEY